MVSTRVDFTLGAPVAVDLNVHWIDGTDPHEPSHQLHRLDAHTFIIRQSLRTSAEGPFVYLLFGNDRAVLFDTGDSDDDDVWPLRIVVDNLLQDWLADHPRERYELLVAHTHGHGDHVAGDVLFTTRPATTIVGSRLDAVLETFGFEHWPQNSATLDLGGRELLLVPSPGHHASAISIYDPWTGILLTGDTVYPGRLYVPDMPAFLTTMNRLAALAAQVRVSHVLGCHIEMSMTPGSDFALGARSHPQEQVLPMTVAQLLAVREAAVSCADEPGVHRLDDAIIYNGNRARDLLWLRWHSLLRRSPLRRSLRSSR